MEELNSGTMAGIIITILTGAGWLVKYMLSERDKRREAEMLERNKRREQIEDNIVQLHEDIDNLQALILECNHDDCETKKQMAEYLRKRRKQSLANIQ